VIRAAGRNAVVLALAGTLAVACSSAKGLHAVTPHASVPTAPAQTTTTNPYAIPAVIDAAYVNRVLAALDAAVGDVVRIVASTKSLPPDAVTRLRAWYTPEELAKQVDYFQQDIAQGARRLKTDPGNIVSQGSPLISARTDCIFAQVARDYRLVSDSPDPRLGIQWVGLVPVDPNNDPNHYNPTPWAFSYDGFEENLVPPRNSCDG
jgi:hypothetical protein